LKVAGCCAHSIANDSFEPSNPLTMNGDVGH
jgi:hypothetical protein